MGGVFINVFTWIGTMRSLITLLVFLLAGVSSQATVYYVHPAGTGNGSSWADAAADLTTVLSLAQAGDEIWVAAGTYTPTSGTDRTISFELRDGVRLFGGFAGSETSRSQRDWSKNPTLLSGEIGEPGIDDNSFHIIYTNNVSDATVVDGFIITAGNANGQVDKGYRTRGGGGWFDEATNGGVSEPTIANCTFLGNRGLEGGAFFSSGQNGSSNPTFRHCRFLGNFAKLDGGAIFSDGRAQSTNEMSLFNCTFQDNMSSYGACIFVETGNDDTALVMQHCVFKKNNAFLWGGGIFYNFPKGGYFDLQIQDCIFEENYPTDINKTRFLSDPDPDLAKR
jgi:predicted outer membrane repeat protein